MTVALGGYTGQNQRALAASLVGSRPFFTIYVTVSR